MKIQKLANKMLKPAYYEFAQVWGFDAAKTAKEHGLEPSLCKEIAFAVILLETCYNLNLELPEKEKPLELSEEVKSIAFELAHIGNYSFLGHCFNIVDNSNVYIKYMFEKKIETKQKFSTVILL